ncbi:hypothetical protein [Brachyspira catarrhinii]|uniref:Uncharacterized protein n=1 Tax=Brachyspira catarrhinii TaxID=2528966 RepID=A0ABY2TTG4_9SPIR|nr:hypothetical protein [Brachyspira catarrhinii]TKZ36152.1 hypothetical protein EZH24_01610 [Brachyspira catarrhinii]
MEIIYFPQAEKNKNEIIDKNYYHRLIIEGLEKAILINPKIIVSAYKFAVKDKKYTLLFRSCPSNKENYLIALYFIVVNNNIYIVDAIHDK